ncbi:GrpB family protein [Prodigiosinella aquatilis]|nr:GrpB family protein [Prodigiosinella sp. LS101]WJV54618.1 GrpB family protein [Prodigiosinella sp. LS101]WJV58980.1 GrpB family protein [Pectobacteriaceae bacterium C111]
MVNKPITNQIVDYDIAWPEVYKKEAAFLLACFCDVSIHHVGSTSIKEMPAKPEIDILIIIPEKSDYQNKIECLGYTRGRDLSAGHQFYKKEKAGVRTYKLYLCHAGHPDIQKMLIFKQHLEHHESDFKAYGELKRKLVARGMSMADYLRQKEPFISGILSKYLKT